jgi:hypothetical protein
VIINEIRFKSGSKKTSSSDNTVLSDVNKYEPKGSNVTDIINESNTYTTYQKLKDALIKNRIGDYIAVKGLRSTQGSNSKEGRCRAAGYNHCRHCGMELGDNYKVKYTSGLHS